MRTTLEKRKSSRGIIFALVSDQITYEVWKLCENYDGHCKGGIRKTWRYVELNMSKEVAEKLFKKRTK